MDKRWRQEQNLDLVWYLLIALAILVFALALWRFMTQRAKGTPVLIRRLPAKGVHGWRHGMLRYDADNLEYYKLRSLSPRPDAVHARDTYEFVGRREMTPSESSFMEPDRRIVQMNVEGVPFEVAFDPRGEMAFMSWLESAPTQRLRRTAPRQARRYFNPEN